MRDQHVEFAAWIQHADPGFRQPGDRPITRLPNDAAELRQYDALLLVDPDLRALGPAVARDDHELRRPGRRRADLRRRRAVLAAALRGGRLQGRPAATGRGSCPSSASRACSGPRPRCGSARQNDLHPGADARGPRRPDLRVPRRPDPQPGDPDQPAGHVLELPGHAGPPRRDGPGPPRRPADAEPVRAAGAAGLAALRARPDGLHRLRQHLPLAVSLRRLFRRLLGPAGRSRGPEQGAGRPVPVPGASGQERLSGRRPGVGRRPLHRGRPRWPRRPSWRPSSRSPASRRSRSGSRRCPTTPAC